MFFRKVAPHRHSNHGKGMEKKSAENRVRSFKKTKKRCDLPGKSAGMREAEVCAGLFLEHMFEKKAIFIPDKNPFKKQAF